MLNESGNQPPLLTLIEPSTGNIIYDEGVKCNNAIMQLVPWQ